MDTGPRRIGKYELQTRLGSGGMAEVWKALDTELHRHVAIKLLHADLQNDPSFITRFEREAQLIASLHHPNIIQIYDFHITRSPDILDTTAYMIMDYVEGQTLTQYLRATSHAGNFPSPADLVYLFSTIGLAIDYAHQTGMIHRDIKPSNILLDQRIPKRSRQSLGEPILSDFGIAKLLGTSTSHHSGWWLGTPYYTSPEQVMGAPGNELSDIYSLSVILYEACTGILPFQGDNPTAIMMQHVSTTPPTPILFNPQIPSALSTVILHGLAKDPAARFASASSFSIALAEALNEPVPEGLQQRAYQIAQMNNPTFISPIHPGARSGRSPATPPMQPASSIVSSSPSLTSAPTQSPNNTPRISRPLSSTATPAQYQSSTPPPPEDPAPPPFKRQRGKIIRIALAIFVFVASIGTLLLLTPRTHYPVTTVNPVVGHAFFTNSGQLNPDNSQGINDEVLLDLHNVPDPQAGKMYYVWLLGDRIQSEASTIPLGRLSVNRGNVSWFYAGNRQHSNLLAYESRILITEENASVVPSMYTPDYKAWKYYAELSQAPGPQDKLHFSMLSHLRHLLSDSPELTLRGLHGGMDMWFLRNTQKILEWSNAARDDWRNSPDLLHRQIVRILDYLDGASFVQKDAPAVGSTLLVNPRDAQVALLGEPPDGQDPPGYSFKGEVSPGYVYLVSSHLVGTVLSPDATTDQRSLAAQIHTAIDEVKNWLEKVHRDAKQLVTMNTTQLAQPSTLSLLDDLVTQTQFAYNGQVDPLTGQSKGGVIWICSNIQRMANFEIKPYTGL